MNAVKFRPAANASGSSYTSFTYAVNDGIDSSTSSSTMTIDVTPANDAPAIAFTPTVTLQDNGNYSPIFSAATLTDIDGGDYNGATITFEVTANSDSGDNLTLTSGTFTLSGSDIKSGATTVGTISGGGTSPLVVTQTASYIASVSAGEGLFSVTPAIDASGVLTFTPAPGKSGVASVSVTVNDGGGTAYGGVATVDGVFNISIETNAIPWIKLTSGTTNNLLDVYGFENREVLASGESGTVLNSKDAGKTWQRLSAGANRNYYAIHATDDFFASYFSLAGDDFTRRISLDKGVSWGEVTDVTTTQRKANSQSSDRFTDLFGIRDSLYAVSNSGIIAGNPFSDNPNSNQYLAGWHYLQADNTSFNGIWAFGSGTYTDWYRGIAVGSVRPAGSQSSSALIYPFLDFVLGMIPYSSQIFNEIPVLYDIWGNNRNDMYVVGDNVVLHSTDQGVQWERKTSSLMRGLRVVGSTDPANIYVAGENGLILHSFDRGETWVQQDSGTSVSIKSLWGSQNTGMYAVGANGTILKLGNIAAFDDEAEGYENISLNIPISALTANDGHRFQKSLTISSVRRVTGGTPVIDGSNVIFTPDENFVGMASFEYEVTDEVGDWRYATVRVNVKPSPLKLDVSPKRLRLAEGQTASIIIHASNASKKPINVTYTTLPGGALTSFSQVSGAYNGVYEFNASANNRGSYTLIIEAEDTTNPTLSTRATVSIESLPIRYDNLLISHGYGGNTLVHVRNTDPRIDANSDGNTNATDITAMISTWEGMPESYEAVIGGGTDRAVYLVSGDITGDGQAELINTFGPPTKAISENLTSLTNLAFIRSVTGDVTLSPPPFPANNPQEQGYYTSGEVRAAIGDFIGSSPKQIAFAQGLGGDAKINIMQYKENPAGGLSGSSLQTVAWLDGLTGEAKVQNASGGVTLAAGDLDGDGLDELVVAQTRSNTSRGTFQVLDLEASTNDSDEISLTVSNRLTYNLFDVWSSNAVIDAMRGDGGLEVAIADITGDRKAELILTSQGNSRNHGDARDTTQYSPPIFILKPVVSNNLVTGFTSLWGSVTAHFNSELNPSSGLTLGVGEFSGRYDDGYELVVGTRGIVNYDGFNAKASMVPQSRVDILSVSEQDVGFEFFDQSFTLKTISTSSLLFNGSEGFRAFSAPYEPSSGTVFVTGLQKD